MIDKYCEVFSVKIHRHYNSKVHPIQFIFKCFLGLFGKHLQKSLILCGFLEHPLCVHTIVRTM